MPSSAYLSIELLCNVQFFFSRLNHIDSLFPDSLDNLKWHTLFQYLFDFNRKKSRFFSPPSSSSWFAVAAVVVIAAAAATFLFLAHHLHQVIFDT